MTLRNNEFVRAAFLNSQDAVLLVDQDRCVIDANAAFLDLFGYKLEDVVTRPVEFLYASQTAYDAMGQMFGRTQDTPGWDIFEASYQTASGRAVTTETRLFRVDDDRRQRLGAVSVIRDLTGHHLRDRLLGRLAREISATGKSPDNTGEAVLKIGLEFFGAEVGVLSIVDGQEQRVRHIWPDGRPLPAGYSREGAPLLESPCNAVIRAEGFAVLETDSHADDAAPEYYYGCPLLIEGRIAGTLAFWSKYKRPDLTAADEAALTLLAGYATRAVKAASTDMAMPAAARLEHALARLYRAAPGIMHTMLWDGSLVDVSDQWLAATGYRRLEVVGQNFTGMLDDQSRSLFQQLYLPGLQETGRLIGVPLTMIGNGGNTLEMELSAAADPDRPDDLVQVGLVDVTDRNRALGAVRQQNERLERANDSLKEFTYVVSHDLQEPLRKMQQFSRFLIEDHAGALGEGGRFYAGSISDAAERMSSLITSLLGYSRESNRELKLRSVDLGKVMVDVLDDMQVAVQESGADIRVGKLPTVYADYLQMFSLFGNLVGNALKYRAAHRTPVIKICPLKDMSAPGFVIEDNGIGFDRQQADQIFEPFRRLHGRTEYPGNGIGLSLCRAICDRHGWDLLAAGNQGAGARFTVTMPPDHLVASAPAITDADAVG